MYAVFEFRVDCAIQEQV